MYVCVCGGVGDPPTHPSPSIDRQTFNQSQSKQSKPDRPVGGVVPPGVDVVVLRHVGVEPAVEEVQGNGVVDVGVVHARGVLVRPCHVGEEAVPHLAVLHLCVGGV